MQTLAPEPKKRERSSLLGWPGYFSCSWGPSLLFSPDGARGCHRGRSGPSRRIFCEISGELLWNYGSKSTINLPLGAQVLWKLIIKFIYPSEISDTSYSHSCYRVLLYCGCFYRTRSCEKYCCVVLAVQIGAAEILRRNLFPSGGFNLQTHKETQCCVYHLWLSLLLERQVFIHKSTETASVVILNIWFCAAVKATPSANCVLWVPW